MRAALGISAVVLALTAPALGDNGSLPDVTWDDFKATCGSFFDNPSAALDAAKATATDAPREKQVVVAASEDGAIRKAVLFKTMNDVPFGYQLNAANTNGYQILSCILIPFGVQSDALLEALEKRGTDAAPLSIAGGDLAFETKKPTFPQIVSGAVVIEGLWPDRSILTEFVTDKARRQLTATVIRTAQ